MVTIVKHEWHSVDRKSCLEFDEDLLSEIYPDKEEDEIQQILKSIEDGSIDIDDVINEAWDNDVDLEWEHQYDDCWTDRKGGYDVTYELGDDDSWHSEPEKDPPTHKCTKCRWQGDTYDTLDVHLRSDGTVIEDYYNSDEEQHSMKHTCPMCDSDTELTEFGIKEEQELQERRKRFNESLDEDESEEENPIPCFSCGVEHTEQELIVMSGQYICPSCGEGWVMPDDRPTDLDEDVLPLEDALDELARDFESLDPNNKVKWPFEDEDKGK